jgi:signal transduction histidine kinase
LKRTSYWIGVLLLPVALIALLDFADRGSRPETYAIHDVVWVDSLSDDPPEFGKVGSQSFPLPGYMTVSEGELPSTWIQAVFRAPAGGQDLWAVYVPYPHGNFAVFVNGKKIGATAPMTRPYAFFREPLFFEFPAGMLRAGTNTLEMHVAAERDFDVAGVHVGPADALKPAYRHQYLLRVPLQRATLVALLVMTLLMIGLFVVRRTDTGNAWFAAANAAWAAHIWLQIEPRVLLPYVNAWFALPILMLLWFTIFSAFFIHRLPGCGGPRPRWERAMVIFGAVSSLVFMITYAYWFQVYVITPAILIMGASIAWRLIEAVRRRPTFESRLWLLGATTCVGVGVHDELIDLYWIDGSLHYLTFTVSIVLIVVGLTILSRISRALTEAETLNRELESRVAAKGAELERNYQALRNLEQERVLSAERERMTRDMHDGIGGQLIHALSVIEGKPQFQPLEPILRGSLDDLRLIIDAADPSGGDLVVVLAGFRSRNERRVREAGLQFEWQMSDLPLLAEFGPNKALQLLRILQEATTNVIRHAGASRLIVRTSTLEADGRGDCVVVDVIDDGTGYSQDAKNGRGLGNMRRRAASLGGTLELTSGPEGSRVRLVLRNPATSFC